MIIGKMWLAPMALALAGATGAIAQDNSNIRGEVRVSATRSGDGYYKESIPVVGLRRTADNAILDVVVTSDAREATVRREEIHAMLEEAIRRADEMGVELVTGDFQLKPVTPANFKDLPMRPGRRPDTSEIEVTIKVKMAGATASAQSRIDAFIKSVPLTGRSLIEKYGQLQLTIVNPDQYRPTVVKLIADESRRTSVAFGADYGVTVSGLDQQLVWSQASESEVFLYLPYRFTVQPKAS